MIEDWEIGMLYWNCLKKHKGDEEKACEDVKKKYFEDYAKTKDYYFILGTTLKHHKTAKNPFIIIGDFRPKPIEQLELFSSLQKRTFMRQDTDKKIPKGWKWVKLGEVAEYHFSTNKID